MIYEAKNTEDTELLGKALAVALKSGGKNRAFVALYGEMGVGKTAFTRGFCSALGIKNVKSPTYTVVNEYVGEKKVYHFDFYRITDEDDLYSIGFDEYVESDGYCVGEWCERIPYALPKDKITVTVSRIQENDNHRKIEISGIDNVNISLQ